MLFFETLVVLRASDKLCIKPLMLRIYQNTIDNPVSFKGIGLHSGKESEITILPAKANQGIIFKRVDIEGDNLIHANYKNVSSAKLCSTLQNNKGVKVSTVEHLLASLYIANIDNALIEINNVEVPIMDGSAKIFLDVLKKAKIKKLDKKIKYLNIIDKVELKDGAKKISIEPSNSSFEVDFKLKYENKIIGKQRNLVNFQNDNLKNVCDSRTFCLLEDIEKIKKLGLAKGGSLDNAIVVDKNRILNSGGLRNEKEFVNHKILDCMGDLYLSGYKMIGKITCSQGGHKLTNEMLKKVFSNNENFSIFELKEKNIPHSFINKTALKSIA